MIAGQSTYPRKKEEVFARGGENEIRATRSRAAKKNDPQRVEEVLKRKESRDRTCAEGGRQPPFTFILH